MRRKSYLLDTNICAYWLRDKYDVKDRVNAVGMVMVTQNVKDFQNIRDIQIENWIER